MLWYDSGQKCGLVTLENGADVLIRTGQGRKVRGTPMNYSITARPLEGFCGFTRAQKQRVIVKVLRNRNRWIALNWGIIPHELVLADVLSAHSLDTYIGGRVDARIIPSGRDAIEGMFESFDLTPEALSVHFGSPRGFQHGKPQTPRALTEVRQYNLHDCTLEAPNEQQIIVLKVNTSPHTVKLRFYPPTFMTE